MPLLRPRHWPTPPRPGSPFRSRSPRPAENEDEPQPAESSSQPPSRVPSPQRMMRSLSPARPRSASPSNPRSKRPLSQHLYQKVASIARSSHAEDPAPSIDESYVHLDDIQVAEAKAAAAVSASDTPAWPSLPSEDPYSSAPVSTDATLCSIFDVVLEPEDAILNESDRTPGSSVLLHELGMVEHHSKGPQAPNTSTPALNDDFDFANMSVTALAYDNVPVNEYNYPKLDKRLRELLETEKSYVHRIKILNEKYAKVLRAPPAAGSTPIISPIEANILFGNVGELVAANTVFLEALDALMKLDTPAAVDGLGDIMQRHMACSSCYAEYLANFPNASALLSKLNKQKAFAAFVNKTKTETTGVGNVGLRELIMEPVQRITRYVLMISGILKYIPTASRTRRLLQSASQIAGDIAQREADAETKQAAVRWSLNRYVDSLPSDFTSKIRHLVDFVDVDDFPLDTDETRDIAPETIPVTLLLFDHLICIIKRAPGSSGTSALGLGDLSSLADLMKASMSEGNRPSGDQMYRANGLLQNSEAAKLEFKGFINLLDIEARDLGGPDFQVRHTDAGVQSGNVPLSARWAFRPMRQYAVVEPPPPGTKLSGAMGTPATAPARIQKTRFLESFWRAQVNLKVRKSTLPVRRDVAPAMFDPVTGAPVRPRQINYFPVYHRSVWESDPRKTPIALHVNIGGKHPRLYPSVSSAPNMGSYAIVELTLIDVDLCKCVVYTHIQDSSTKDEIPLPSLTEYLYQILARVPSQLRTNFISPPVHLASPSTLAPLTPPHRVLGQNNGSSGPGATTTSNSPPRLRDVKRHLLSATGIGSLRRSVSPIHEGSNDFAALGYKRFQSRPTSSAGGTLGSGGTGSVGSNWGSNWGSTLTSTSDHTRGTVATTLSATSGSSGQASPKKFQTKRSFNLLSRTRTPSEDPNRQSLDSVGHRADALTTSLQPGQGDQTRDSITPTPSPYPSHGQPGMPSLDPAAAPGHTTIIGGQSMVSETEADPGQARELPTRSSTLPPHRAMKDQQDLGSGPRSIRSSRLRVHPPAPLPLEPVQGKRVASTGSKRVASERLAAEEGVQGEESMERPMKRASIRSARSAHSAQSAHSDRTQASSLQFSHTSDSSRLEGIEKQIRCALSRVEVRQSAFADMRRYLSDVRNQHQQRPLDSEYLSNFLAQLVSWLQDAENDSVSEKTDLDGLLTSLSSMSRSTLNQDGQLEEEIARLVAEIVSLQEQEQSLRLELQGLYDNEKERIAEVDHLHTQLSEAQLLAQKVQAQSQIRLENNQELAVALEAAQTANQAMELAKAENAELVLALKQAQAARQDIQDQYEVLAQHVPSPSEQVRLEAAQKTIAELKSKCEQLEQAERYTRKVNAELHTAFNEELDNMWRYSSEKSDNEEIQFLRQELKQALAERNQLRSDLHMTRIEPELHTGF